MSLRSFGFACVPSSNPPIEPAAIDEVGTVSRQLRETLGRDLVGQSAFIDQLVVTLLAGGHALVEGVPGLAKTRAVQAMAAATSLEFSRIQFTPDLMPADITGGNVLTDTSLADGTPFRFEKGPVFANLVLADEINRTPPKTQAALLQCMEERTVSAGGVDHSLPNPFFVFATQNPIEQGGTYPLPEAQLDRFLLKCRVGYPSAAEEQRIYRNHAFAEPWSHSAEAETPAIDGETLLRIQRVVAGVECGELVLDYVTRLVRESRPESTTSDEIRESVHWGIGPRGGLALLAAARARAAMRGRPLVEPGDIQAMIEPCFEHRLLPSYQAASNRMTTVAILQRLGEHVPFRANARTAAVAKFLRPRRTS